MAKKADEVASNIAKLLEHAEKWERKNTPIPGVYLVRLPGEELLVKLWFNPPDANGNPTKKKGLFFEDMDTVAAARAAFNHKKLDDLIAGVEIVNRKAGKGKVDASEMLEL